MECAIFSKVEVHSLGWNVRYPDNCRQLPLKLQQKRVRRSTQSYVVGVRDLHLPQLRNEREVRTAAIGCARKKSKHTQDAKVARV